VTEPAETSQPAIEAVKFVFGRDTAMVDVMRRLERIAATDVTVLIEGETGTGKELAARAIHERSGRRGRPFVPINIGAIPEPLLADHLFGHEAGAFTDGRAATLGWLEAATGGTLFLDEVGELPHSAQVKLLRVLEERKVARLGSRKMLPIDVRFVAATNRNLKTAASSGHFRSDLYYRLAASTLHLPPVRERGEDVQLLLDHCLRLVQYEFGIPIGLSPAAYRRLLDYPWPGNVREMQNALRDGYLNAPTPLVEPEHLRLGSRPYRAAVLLPKATTLAEAWTVFEQQCIDQALRECRGNKEAAAKRLGIDPKTLRRKLAAGQSDSSSALRPEGGLLDSA
jgi:DNA-binding NtrC family response regulator